MQQHLGVSKIAKLQFEFGSYDVTKRSKSHIWVCTTRGTEMRIPYVGPYRSTGLLDFQNNNTKNETEQNKTDKKQVLSAVPT